MKKNSGFTLIEVLVSVIILAVGLVGLAGLQGVGLANNQSAYNRSQVAQLAYDIADRMRSNATSANSYQVGSPATCPNNTAPICTACAAPGALCSTSQIAQKDLFEWNTALAAVVPGGVGAITVAGGVYVITVNWDDDKSGAPNTSFVMRFRI